MKLKGINVFEQYVDKIVLVVALLFFLVMFVLQFDVLGDPNAVAVQKDKVSPEQAVERVRQLAQQKRAELESDRIPDLPPVESPSEIFARALGHSGTPTQALALGPGLNIGGEELRPDDGGEPISPMDVRFAQIIPPAPDAVVANVFGGTIDPLEPLLAAELARYLPASQPLDAFAVSVQASFDGQELLARLQNPGEGVAPVRQPWYQDIVEILDVELLRQELRPDGSWTESQSIIVPPGQFSLRDEITGNEIQPKDRHIVLNAERDNRAQIRRPDFYNMISGDYWIWPAKAAELRAVMEQQKDIQRLQNQYRELKRQRDQLIEQLQRPGQGRPPEEEDERPPRADAGAPDGRFDWPEIPPTWFAQGGFGGTGAGGEGTIGGDDKDGVMANPRVRRIQEQMDRIAAELLERFGVEDPEAPLSEQLAGVVFEEPLFSITDPDADPVTVWAHDITAERGKTYRYRVRVWVTNPYFGQARMLPEEQKSLAEGLAIPSETSPWSEPVLLPGVTRYYITTARPSGAGVLVGQDAAATSELYRFYYGYWRKASIQMDPGDRMIATLTLPETTELPLFDIALSSDGSFSFERSLLDNDIELERDAFLLDVLEIAGSESSGSRQVFLRDLEGEIVVRDPRDERESLQRLLMDLSHGVGLTAIVRNPGGQPGTSPDSFDDGGRGPGGNQPPNRDDGFRKPN